MKRVKLREACLAILIGVLVLAVYLNSGNRFSSDSKWTIHTALSLVREGNADLDEYRAFVEQHDEYGALETFNGHVYTNFPIGPSLLAVPFVAGLDLLARQVWHIDLNAYIGHTIPSDIEALIAGLVVALTAVVIYGIARLRLRWPYALFLTLVFAFGTSAWSTASRALWQHGPSMLWLSLTLYVLLLAQRKPFLSQFAALPLALAYVSRPGNNIAVMLLTIYVFWQYRRYFVRYLLWAAVVAVPFVLYNWSIYHALLPPYFTLYHASSLDSFVTGAIGTLFSPSRGLLIFSPVLLLSFAGVIVAIKRRTFQRLDAFLCGIIITNWIITSLWPIWWGGWSFGPRLLSDYLPFWIYLMIPAVEAFATWPRTKKWLWGSLALLLTSLSVFIHYRGANVSQVMDDWNRYPANVDTHPDRLWDWRDPQFLRGLTWGQPIDLSISGVPNRQVAVDTLQQLGTNAPRFRRFDANAALIAAPGDSWFLLADRKTPPPELTALLEGMIPVSQDTAPESGDAYRLYHVDLGARLQHAAQQALQIVYLSADLYPDRTAVRPIDLPVSFGDIADLIGVEIKSGASADERTIITYWRARASSGMPLRVFVHAVAADGQIVTQDDRLDVNPKDWQPGDLFVQVNRLTLPPDAGPVWIEAGFYNPDSGERLPVMVDGQDVDQRVLLGLLEIK